MTYLLSDVGHYVETSPCDELETAQAALPFLTLQLTLLEQCDLGLESYREEQAEPLDFFYTVIRGLGVLDEEVLQTMLHESSWQGVVWAGWLALMQPKAEWLPLLRAATTERPGQLWTVRAAIAATEKTDLPEDLVAVVPLAARCRNALSGIDIERRALRQVPVGIVEAEVEALRERIRQAYRKGGADAATTALRSSQFEDHLLSYPNWYAKQRKRTSKPK